MRRLVTHLALAGTMVFGGVGALVFNSPAAHADPPAPYEHTHFLCFTNISDVFAQTGHQAKTLQSEGYSCYRLTRTAVAPWPDHARSTS